MSETNMKNNNDNSLEGSKSFLEKTKEVMKKIFAPVGKIRKAIRKNKWLSLLVDTMVTLAMFAVAGAIGVFVAVGQHAGSVEKYAREYFDAYINQDWQTMYSYMEIKENEYINYDSFERMMDSMAIYGEFSEVNVKVTKKTDNNAYVDIVYKDEDTGKDTVFTVKLKKQEEKVYRFFSTWKVDGETFVINNCKIEVPTGVTVTLDSKDVSQYLKKSENGTDLYVIDRLFKGEHDFGVSTVYIDAFSETEYIDESGHTFSVSIDEFDMKSEDIEYVENATNTIVFGMYSNVLSEAGIENLKTYFGDTDEDVAMLKQCYDDLYNAINQENGATLKSMDIDSYTTYRFSYVYPDTVEMRLDFSCSYTAKTGRTMINGVRGSYEGNATSTARVIYKLSGDKWIVDEIDLKCFNYDPPAEEEE